MFKKLVAIEPVSLIPTAEEALHQYAEQVELYRDIPADDEEIVRRIGDADAALLSYTSRMGKNVIERCPNLRYIGMCCSLYSEEAPMWTSPLPGKRASRCWASGTTATAAWWSTSSTS